jgi:FAD/FMN-containing dehydrogenase
MLINKTEYNENFLTGEIVIGNGELFWMGTALAKGMVGQSNPEAFILGTRLFRGHQGTLGVVTWANIKTEFIPAKDKLYFIPCETIEEIAAPLYQTQQAMIGGELFVLNNLNFAAILAQLGLGEFEALRGSLPPYTVAINLHGLRRDPDGRIAYEEAALKKIATELGITPTLELAGIQSHKVMELLRSPWPGEPHWRFYPKPGSAEIFFHSTLDRATEFADRIAEIAEANGHPPADIGVYVQPIERARIARFSFSFNYDPADAAEAKVVSDTFLEASRAVAKLGGLFTNPYGPWAEMAFSGAEGYVNVMRAVKDTFDPNHIMNPDKLCFQETA